MNLIYGEYGLLKQETVYITTFGTFRSTYVSKRNILCTGCMEGRHLTLNLLTTAIVAPLSNAIK